MPSVTAMPDLYGPLAGGPYNGSSVLANDTSSANLPLTASLQSGPTFGSAVVNFDGTFTYTPNAGYTGPDSFIYTATDGVDSATAVVSLNVTSASVPPGNPPGTPPGGGTSSHAPVANDDIYFISDTDPAEIDVEHGVLANDWDLQHTLTATLLLGPQHGVLSFNADGSFDYVPNANYPGVDTFTYQASDGTANSGPVTVTLTSGMYAVKDAYLVGHGQVLDIGSDAGVLANDLYDDNVPMVPVTIQVVTNPMFGLLAFDNTDGSFTYTPNPGFVGLDSFTYQIVQGASVSNIATVGLQVVNEAPVANESTYLVAANTTLSVSAASGVLKNAYDAEGDTVTADLVQAPLHGQLTLNADGGFSFVPAPGFQGNDEFWIRPFDGHGFGLPVRIALNIGQLAVVAPPPQITISGKIFYDTVVPAVTIHPVRGARVDLVVKQGGVSVIIDTTFTQDSGAYSFTVPTGVFPANSLSVVVSAESRAPALGDPQALARGVAVIDLGLTNLNSALLAELARRAITTAAESMFPLLRLLSLNSPDYGQPYRLLNQVPGNYVANTTQNISIGSTTENEKAFWTFDAAMTGARLYSTFPGIKPDWDFFTFHNLQDQRATSLTPPTLQFPIIKLTDFDNFDTVIHEYGHRIQHNSNFFPFTIPQYAVHAGMRQPDVLPATRWIAWFLQAPELFFIPNHINEQGPFGAPAFHLGHGNLRLANQDTWRQRVNELAFSEGWANFFSVAAQQQDPTCPSVANGNEVKSAIDNTWKSGDRSFRFQDIDVRPGDRDIDDENRGEDDEVTVMRVLWDLSDGANPANNADEAAKDRIELGINAVFGLLARPNPDVTPRAFTLSEAMNKLKNALPAFRDTIDLGALLELNNVSPKVEGIELGGVLVTQIQHGNANLPKLIWQVPEGEPLQPLVRELLNSFTIRIYNDDYSAVLLDSSSLSRAQGNVSIVDFGIDAAGVQRRPIKLGWIPSQAQWNNVLAALGNKHLVVLGRLVTEEFRFLKTGDYFSDAFDFNVVA